MTDGDDEPEDAESGADEPEPTADDGGEGNAAEPVTAEKLHDRLDDAEEKLAAADTEADLDVVEEKLDAIEADLEAADLSEPDEEEGDEDEEAEDPAEELESRLSELRSELEDARGPYAEEVVETVESVRSEIESTRWTDQGEREVAAAVESFAAAVEDALGAGIAVDGGSGEAAADALGDAAEEIEAADLHPDDDAETIAALVEAADQLESDVEDAQAFDDLSVRGQLRYEGYYEVIGHYKDYPPEWSALKEHEQRGDVEMVLLALEKLDSEFMEEHCVDSLTRMGDPAAFDVMHQRAQKRNKPAIRALGKMGQGASEAVETLLEYVDADSDPKLQKVTFRTLGEIGDDRATQSLANKLEMDNDKVRPIAARALGLIGDTRAVKPLSGVLEDDESDSVRASAAWALRQIGTEEALEAASEYADDRAFLVQQEAESAGSALDRDADAKQSA